MSLASRIIGPALLSAGIAATACTDSTAVRNPSSPVILEGILALSQTQTFASDPTWGAQNVCLNAGAPSPCPAGATIYGYSGAGWGVSLATIPGAKWIWGVGVTGATTPAFPAGFTFTKTINLPGAPISGSISIAADDFAQVFVNSTSVGTIGSVSNAGLAAIASTTLTTFDISSFLILGNNVIRVDAANGNFGCGAGAYNCNPAGTVFGGSLVSQSLAQTHGPLTTYPSPLFTGHVMLCKNASSLAGTYTYTIASSGTVAGDVVQTDASLTPGQCRIIFSRLAFSLATVSLTITETPGAGFVVHNIVREQTGNPPATFAGPSGVITATVNSTHGAVVTYTNIAAPAG